MPLTFAPACLAVLRGGLPHSVVQAALSAVLATTPELPTWPALAQRSFRETAVVQAAAGFPGLLLDVERERIVVDRAVAERGIERVGLAYLRSEPMAGALPADYATGLGELLRLVDHGHRVLGLKGDLLGPISLSLQLTDEHERPLAYDPPLREALLQHLALRIAWLHEELSIYTDNVVICLDEPFLDALGSPFCPLDWDQGSELLDRVLVDAPGLRGISTGGALNWAAVLATPVELVLFDAYEHGAALIQAAGAVAGFLDRGGVLGWGIVPNDPIALGQEQIETLTQRLETTVGFLAASSRVSSERILEAALITTSGSLAHLSVEMAEQALALCAGVSRQLREKYTF